MTPKRPNTASTRAWLTLKNLPTTRLPFDRSQLLLCLIPISAHEANEPLYLENLTLFSHLSLSTVSTVDNRASNFTSTPPKHSRLSYCLFGLGSQCTATLFIRVRVRIGLLYSVPCWLVFSAYSLRSIQRLLSALYSANYFLCLIRRVFEKNRHC